MKSPLGILNRCFAQETLYLGFLRFESEDLPHAFKLLRKARETHDLELTDLKSLLNQSGWREHLTACAAMLTDRELAATLAVDTWRAFDSGSWVSPQLAVTMFLCDSRFAHNAKARIESACAQDTSALASLQPLERHVIAGPGSTADRAAKGMAAIFYLLGFSPENVEWLRDQLARPEVKALLELDVDKGGTLAERWLANVRARSGELRLQVK